MAPIIVIFVAGELQMHISLLSAFSDPQQIFQMQSSQAHNVLHPLALFAWRNYKCTIHWGMHLRIGPGKCIAQYLL